VNFDLPGIVRAPESSLHVFIAYDYQDQDFARKLAVALRRDRVSLFTELGEMAAGDSLTARLASTMRPVECVIPIVSAASVTRSWIGTELAQFAQQDAGRRTARVCPVKVDDCALPTSLAGYEVADFRRLGWNGAYESLRAAIAGHSGIGRPSFKQPVVQPSRTAARGGTVPIAGGVKQVYLCFDHERDGYYKDVLVTWSKMPGFAHFWINEQPPPAAVDSAEAEPVKQTLGKRIGAASGLLCVLGEGCCTNGWMEWEVRKADELGKRIIAVRINRDCAVPELLSDIGATCAMSFTFEGIRRAIGEAYGESSQD